MVDIKSELVYKRMKLVDLVKLLEAKRGKKISYGGLSTRLKNGDLKLSEAEEILGLIGAKLIVVEKDNLLDKNA